MKQLNIDLPDFYSNIFLDNHYSYYFTNQSFRLMTALHKVPGVLYITYATHVELANY